MDVLDKLQYLTTNSWNNITSVIEPLIRILLVILSLSVILFWPVILATCVDAVLEHLKKRPKVSKLYNNVLPTTVTIFQILWLCSCLKTMIDYI